MSHTQQLNSSSHPLRAMAELDDQWLLFAERSAFIGEAYARLLADHPNIPREIIEGGEKEIRQLRKQSQEIGKQLVNARELLQTAMSSTHQPKDQD